MLRKWMLMALAALMLFSGTTACFAEQFTIENVPPDEPVETDGEFIRVVAEYDAASDLTRYTATLADAAFADGSPLTAQDLLFTLYCYLDPGCSSETAAAELPISGLRSYRLQVTEERLNAALEAMSAIREAGPDHVWSEGDPWTGEQQSAYWALYADYAAACAAEYPNCAQSIVDYCTGLLAADPAGAFGMTSEEIAADDGLRVAYAMLQWGYATCVDNVLVAKHSQTLWLLSDATPTLDDFVHELQLVYGEDLGACWAIESSGNYTPALPDLEGAFLEASFDDERDSVTSISGIRAVDENTLEVDLEDIDMHSAAALFGLPVLSLSALGDAALWSPEEGLYGHPFGDVSAIDIDSFDGPVLVNASSEIVF